MMNLLQHVRGGMAQLKLSIPSFTVDRTLWSPTAVWAAWYFLRFGLFARLKQTALTTWPFSLGVVAEISSLRESCLFCRDMACMYTVTSVSVGLSEPTEEKQLWLVKMLLLTCTE